jgi:hypothetical protein
VHNDLTQQRECRLDMLPDPYCQPFAGRVVEAFDVIEVMVIEAVVDWFERRLDIGEVHDPTGLRIDIATDMQFDPEGMPMQARALMPWRNMGQPVCCFDGKDFENVHGRALRIAGPRCELHADLDREMVAIGGLIHERYSMETVYFHRILDSTE